MTQTPPGTINITDPNNWGGVVEYSLAGTGAAAVQGTGIGSLSLTDPAGLAYSSNLGELFVGNRDGNQSNSTISRFVHAPGGAFTANGSIGSGLTGVHQVAISPTTGELFAATFGGGVFRYTFSGTVATANGSISTGTSRGVAVSPDGNRLYVSTASNIIRQFDLTTNTELPSFTVAGASALHFMRFRGNNELYVSDFGSSEVFRISVVNDNLTASAGVAASTGAISVAFSPDLQEMYVSDHQVSTSINRFLFNSGTNSWDPNGSINVGTSLGDILVIPEPTLMALAGGIFGVLVCRRKRSLPNS